MLICVTVICDTAKPTADAGIDYTDLVAAGIAQMYHLRDFRSPAILEFFNTIGAKLPFAACPLTSGPLFAQ
jgi:hypothetical protein